MGGPAVVEELRQRIARLEGGGPARLGLPTHAALADVVRLRAGGSYGVDSASLALALLAEASRSGEWVAVAGWRDLGVQAAADLGVDLARTIWVPEPGEHWLEVTAALVDVVRVVLLHPPAGLDPRSAARSASVLEARLRTRSAALVVWGEWPRCEARLGLEAVRWAGVEHGHGLLRTRRARVAVRRGSAPPRHADLWFPDETGALAGDAGAAEVAAATPWPVTG